MDQHGTHRGGHGGHGGQGGHGGHGGQPAPRFAAAPSGAPAAPSPEAHHEALHEALHGEHGEHGHGRAAGRAPEVGAAEERRRLNRLAVSATLHCLTGCAIGEVLGMVIGTALGWTDLQTIALAVALAFLFGYSLTIAPVLRSGLAFRAALGVALAADTLSITVMEVVDNAIMLAIPGAMDAGVTSVLFWGSLAVALAIAFVVTVPVNRALIRRGRGHAVVHQHHH